MIMRYKFHVYSYAIVSTLTLFLVATSAKGQNQVDDREQKVAVNLYLMRNLEHTLETWKPPSEDPVEMGIWVYTTRKRLKGFKTTAEAYKLDEDVIRAYEDVLKLLEHYEGFLKEIVLYDLVGNMARPSQKHFLSYAAGEGINVIEVAAGGVAVGGAIGSVIPGLGTIAGAAVGGVVGGGFAAGKTALDAIFDYRNTVANTSIDGALKNAKVQHIDILTRHFSATRDNLQHLARILGGPQKYGWGSQVGFDGSLELPVTHQLKLRPNDPFLHATIGTQVAEANPNSAVEALIKAAKLVPQDFDAQVDFFDLDRSNLLLTAARVAEFGSRRSNGGSVKLASLSVSCYREARKCVERKDAKWARDIKVVYARACAASGQNQEANDMMNRLLEGSPDDPWLLYDYACVKSMMHESASPVYYLRRSFTFQPRWQPSVLDDSCLTFAIRRHKEEIERICANPLIGKWVDSKGLVLEFFEDGTSKQTSGYATKLGKYEQIGDDKINLTRNETIKSYTYELSKTRLKLTDGGKIYELTRSSSSLFGKWKNDYDEFEFRDNGNWSRRRKDVVSTGIYFTMAPRDGRGAEIRCLQNNVLKPEVEKRFEFEVQEAKIGTDTLKIRPWNDTSWYNYSRQ